MTSHKQWQLLVNQNGYGTTQHPIANFRAAIDQVLAPAAPPPPEPPSPPVITAQSQGLSVLAGASAAFTVTAGGSAPLSYRWQKNGELIAGAVGPTLTLANAQPADAGDYAVLVGNSAGSVTSAPATLTVIEPVALTVQPKAQKVVAGTTVRFTAAATGTAPLTFEWRKNGRAISGATNATLVLENVTLAQSGDYTVQVSNAGNAGEC